MPGYLFFVLLAFAFTLLAAGRSLTLEFASGPSPREAASIFATWPLEFLKACWDSRETMGKSGFFTSLSFSVSLAIVFPSPRLFTRGVGTIKKILSRSRAVRISHRKQGQAASQGCHALQACQAQAARQGRQERHQVQRQRSASKASARLLAQSPSSGITKVSIASIPVILEIKHSSGANHAGFHDVVEPKIGV